MKKALLLLLLLVAPLAGAQEVAAPCVTPPTPAGSLLADFYCEPWQLAAKDTQCGHWDTPAPTYVSTFGGPGSLREVTDTYPTVGTVTAPAYTSGATSGDRYLSGPFPGTSCEGLLTISRIERICSCLWTYGSEPGDYWIEYAGQSHTQVDTAGYCNFPACIGGAPELEQ